MIKSLLMVVITPSLMTPMVWSISKLFLMRLSIPLSMVMILFGQVKVTIRSKLEAGTISLKGKRVMTRYMVVLVMMS